MKAIRLLLVDDHRLIIDGMKSMMKGYDFITVSGEANNGLEALQLLDIINVDIVLMDIDMPIMNGIDALKEIKKNKPDTKVIILSMHEEAGMIKSIMAIGANGYILKNSSQDELVNAIVKVYQGKNYFSAGVTQSLLNETQNQGSQLKMSIEILTSREEEILRLIASGYSNKEIGSKLFISHRTVDTHRTNLMNKLNVTNIAGLISYAIKKGLV